MDFLLEDSADGFARTQNRDFGEAFLASQSPWAPRPGSGRRGWRVCSAHVAAAAQTAMRMAWAERVCVSGGSHLAFQTTKPRISLMTRIPSAKGDNLPVSAKSASSTVQQPI